MNRAKIMIVLAGALALDAPQGRAVQVEPAWSSVPAAGVFTGAYAGIGTLFQRQDVVLTSTRLLGGRSGAGEGWTFRLWLDGNDDRGLPSRVIPIDYCQPLFCAGCSGSNDLALCKLRFGVHPGRVEAMRVAFAEPEAGQELRVLTWQGGFGEKLARTIHLAGPFSYDGFRHPEVLFAQGDQGGPVVDDLDQIVAVNSAAQIEMGKEFLYWFGNPVDHVFDLLQWADGRTGFPDSYHCSGVPTIWDLNHDGEPPRSGAAQQHLRTDLRCPSGRHEPVEVQVHRRRASPLERGAGEHPVPDGDGALLQPGGLPLVVLGARARTSFRPGRALPAGRAREPSSLDRRVGGRLPSIEKE